MHKKTHFHGHQNWPLKGLQGVSLCRQEFPDHMDDEHLVDGGGGGGGGQFLFVFKYVNANVK